MSHSTTAAVRQYEMNVNITLLTTTTCAARPNFRPDQEPLESNGDDITSTWDQAIPRKSHMGAQSLKEIAPDVAACIKSIGN